MADGYWQQVMARRSTRRWVLGAGMAGAAGMAGSFALACSGSGDKQGSSGAAGSSAPAAGSPAAGAAASESKGKPGGSLVLSHSGNPVSYEITDSFSYIVSGFVSLAQNGLLTYHNGTAEFPDPVDNTLVPDLASSLPEQPDKQTYVFKLRPAVKWQNKAPMNGRALTAEDIKWSYERAAGISYDKSVLKADFDVIGKVEAVDPQTVKMTLKKPYSPFLNMIVGGFNRYIQPREVGEAGNLKTNLVGTGPFMLDRHEQNVRAVFKKNPDYFKKDAAGQALPYVDDVTWLIIGDSGARLQADQSRQANVSWILLPDELEQLKATNSNDFNFLDAPGISDYIYMRLDKPPFNDKRVRQAMAMALDRKAMIQALGRGKGDVDLPIPIFLKDQSLSIDKMGEPGKFYSRNIAEAKKLMEAAGFGSGIKTTMSYTAQYGAVFVQAYQLVQGYLKEIGIDAEAKQIEYAPYLSTVFRGEFEGLAYGPRGLFPDAEPFFGYFYRPGSIYYQDHSNDQQLLAMLDKEAGAFEKAERQKTLDEIQIYLSDQQYRVYDVAITRSFAWAKNVKNYRGSDWFPYSHFETAWLEK
jgi:peptide/nickel transport system substrate-binding protein